MYTLMWETAFTSDPLIDHIPRNAWYVSRAIVHAFRNRALWSNSYALGGNIVVEYTVVRIPRAPRNPGVSIQLPFQWLCVLWDGSYVVEKSIHTPCHTLLTSSLFYNVKAIFPHTFGDDVCEYDLDGLLLDLGVPNGLNEFQRHLTDIRDVTGRMRACIHEYRRWDRHRCLRAIFYPLSNKR